MVPVVPQWGGNSIDKQDKKISETKAIINFEVILLLVNIYSYHTNTFSDKDGWFELSRPIPQSEQIWWTASFVRTNVWRESVQETVAVHLEGDHMTHRWLYRLYP